MNQREAMQALLDGKRLTADTLARPIYLELRSDGMLYWCSGQPAALARHVWQIYEVPNPHPKGTFSWAREEAKRGKTVFRSGYSLWRLIAADFHNDRPFKIEHIDATDWNVVP